MTSSVEQIGVAGDSAKAEPAGPTPRVIRLNLPTPSLNSVLSLALITLPVLWRTWAVLHLTFWESDWVYQYDAARLPFFHYAFREYPTNHLIPGQFGLVWLVTKIAPLNFGVAQAPLLLLTFVGGVLMWRFLRALFGDRPANLVPLAVFMLCPLSLPPALWWAGALTIIPLQVFIVATLFAVLRYVRAPSRGRLLAVGLAYGGALLFWEKALLILPLVALFVLLFLGESAGRARLRNVTVGRWPMWTLLAGITAAYLPWYLAVAHSPVQQRLPVSQVLQLARVIVGFTIVPTYLGGPWSVPHTPWWFLWVSPEPSPMRLVSWALAGSIVGGSLLLRRQAWRAWILPSIYLGLCIALVAAGRLSRWGTVGPLIGLEAKYVADSVPVLAVAIALAFMKPLDRRGDPRWDRRRRRPIPPVPNIGQDALNPDPEDRSSTRNGRQWAASKWPVGVIGVVVVYAVSAMITSVRMVGLAEQVSGKRWVATVRSELAAHPSASIFDTPLPIALIPVFNPALGEGVLASHALAPIAPHIRWNAPDEHPLMFDDAGHLRPVQLVVATSSLGGLVPSCGYQVNGAPVTVPLRAPLFSWSWGIRLAYSATAGGAGFVTVDGDRRTVRFVRGDHSLTLLHHGTATSVRIESYAGPLCVGDIQVGEVKPLPRGEP